MLSTTFKSSLLKSSLNFNQLISKRFLSVHEYRSAALLRKYGVPTPVGDAAFTPEEAFEIASKIKSDGIVIKAQSLTGGRGKGYLTSGLKSGVHIVESPTQIKDLASQMLGFKIVTKQTGEAGRLVSAVYVVEKASAAKEAYLSIILDRANQAPLIVASAQGGMDIEGVAAKDPSAIKTFLIDLKKGVDNNLALKIASVLGFDKQALPEAAKTIQNLYNCFISTDSTQIEINPLSETPDHKVLAMDAKLAFDNSAEFRQKDIFSWRDFTQEDPDEVEASKFGLNFIKLNGNIGCLVNGAGLAMATMDIIKLYGGDPANFLDVGGGATPETIEKAFSLILSEKSVKAIFVNIFGGIVRCDYVAEGLIAATKNLGVKVPIIVRLQGTNLQKAKDLIDSSGLKIYSFDGLDEAAKNAVKLAL
ncbi:succinate--CoA ligase (GDP-forming) subunit beta [Ascoidea rubescens DSM 1968]|uniref:Succinate--CoA ligase [ADP-forming] subunit beta, mitochondrial n=1 Tax=Ascoidea rubescens DSM 1968 TaxID=1344418 RepID=A0A1D2VDZ4_9ASCO|nr:succinyl-CoA ligase beta-chain mitochondrial precursor [Ascoidea rubescens DSM 1968]ODV59713.1 succinyl-CoA ligase beta-chain mitochondrial precursor [Ascoidea rubescens DSM 1968]